MIFFCGVGILPALKSLVTMVQDVSTSGTILKNRQDACSTKMIFFCGVGILPALKSLVTMVQDVS
jgi:hypothetical protein